MITVYEADQILSENLREFGTENIPLSAATGRVLAESLFADRDMPPFNRAAMDGIAIKYSDIGEGYLQFDVIGVQAAGGQYIELNKYGTAIEIMTGAAVPASADTIIPYENIIIENRIAKLIPEKAVKFGQHIHIKGKDKKMGDIVAQAPIRIDATIVSVAATVGKTHLKVFKHPKVAVITTGNELVSAGEVPNEFQIRKSNSYTIVAALSPYQLFPDVYHFDDDKDEMQERITQLVTRYDVIILSGAVSLGKFDYLPEAMEQAGITKLFHKVQQRPGKPFWLGRHPNGVIAFALPGNPVSTFMCLYRYFMPWLFKCYHLTISPVGCILETEVIFEPTLEYFMQVNVKPNENGQLIAKPLQGNGSGDLGNLVVANGFMQLPAYQNKFDAGKVYPVWIFKADT